MTYRTLECKNCKKDISYKKEKRAKFCNLSCAVSFNNRLRRPKQFEERPCLLCEELHKNKNNFCCKRCARSYSTRFDDKTETKSAKCTSCNKIKRVNKRASAKGYLCNECLFISRTCEYCEKAFKSHPKRIGRFCSRDCVRQFNTRNTNMGSLGGIASASKRVLRSKDEIALYNLIDENFHFNLRHNEPVLESVVWDADIIIDEIKTVILWNGPWHYKEMGLNNHSLKQVQNRDRIKTSLFQKNGWTVIVYRDDEFTPLAAFKDFKEKVA